MMAPPLSVKHGQWDTVENIPSLGEPAKSRLPLLDVCTPVLELGRPRKNDGLPHS
jgi:hypothetical protein